MIAKHLKLVDIEEYIFHNFTLILKRIDILKTEPRQVRIK